VLIPEAASISIYVVMAAVLLWRPNGILGARDV
jgi:branched-chain amino acid transport system permease protein